MILQIGNRIFNPIRKKSKSDRGISFIEVMVALAVLSFGIVTIYKSFLISLDYIQHLSYRSCAHVLLENRIDSIQKNFELHKRISFSQIANEEVKIINKKRVRFQYDMDMTNVGKLFNIYQLRLSLLWDESGKRKKLSRMVYIANYDRIDPSKVRR